MQRLIIIIYNTFIFVINTCKNDILVKEGQLEGSYKGLQVGPQRPVEAHRLNMYLNCISVILLCSSCGYVYSRSGLFIYGVHFVHSCCCCCKDWSYKVEYKLNSPKLFYMAFMF